MKKRSREEEKIPIELLESRERKFQYKQARLRASIRIQQKRAKAIDFILTNADLDQESVFTEIRKDPCIIFLLKGTEELLNDIKTLIKQVQDDKDALELFNNWLILCQNELDYTFKMDNPEFKGTIGVNDDVYKEIVKILDGKSLSELILLEENIKAKMEDKERPVDTEFWDSLLKELKIFKAKARVIELQDEFIKLKLKKIREHFKEESEEELLERFTLTIEDAIEPENNGVEYLDEDVAELEKSLKVVESKTSSSLDNSSKALEWLSAELKGHHSHSEEVFIAEATEAHQRTYDWQVKYIPVKPLCYNKVIRVHDWNKYNQAHFDYTNLPPKTIVGYRFNIFYGEMVDKTITPSFRLEKDPKDEQFHFIRFMAGAPYADLVFRILNEEWEHSHRRGFKCMFDRGVFRLMFYYKKWRYRRYYSMLNQ